MDVEAEQAAFAEEAARFTEIFNQALANSKGREVSIFGKVVASIMDFAGRPKVSMRDAFDGLNATLEVLRGLVEKARTYDEAHGWVVTMRAVTDELKTLVVMDWQSRTKAYAPLTQAFKGAAGALKLAKSKADQLANQLNLAADVLGAFTKLLSAFA